MDPARVRFGLSALVASVLSWGAEHGLVDVAPVDRGTVELVTFTLVVLATTEWVCARIDRVTDGTLVEAAAQVWWAVVFATTVRCAGSANGVLAFATGLVFALVYVDVVGRDIDPSGEFSWDVCSPKSLHYLLAALFVLTTALVALCRIASVG